MDLRIPPRLAIRFEPGSYSATQPWLMGRQIAGNGFLRAAVHARPDGPMAACTPWKTSADAFGAMIKQIDPNAESIWVRPEQLGASGPSVLYLADPNLPNYARLRLRHGIGKYSLCGVTHTISSPGAMGLLTELLSAPVAPWDALICTSSVAREVVRKLHEAETDYLRWKFGGSIPIASPQLPVIPLGVHCADFDITDTERASARSSLSIEDDEIVVLYVGRLLVVGKAHPFQMLRGLQLAAERTGRRIVLLQCGWSPNEAIAKILADSPPAVAPGVRSMILESRNDVLRRQAWACGDIFVSLSDGMQETFGLTPIEAMAAGLPCVVSDWNGYKDTVRDGVDGFRIATWTPAPGTVGNEIAERVESGAMNYDEYSWATSAATSVDLEKLTTAFGALIQNSSLRRTMGASGRRRALECFDWARIYKLYEELWVQLDAMRASHARDDAPGSAAAPDPFHAFGHYATHQIIGSTQVRLSDGVEISNYEQRFHKALFPATQATPQRIIPILIALQNGPASVADIAERTRGGPHATAVLVGMLAKMDLLRLSRT